MNSHASSSCLLSVIAIFVTVTAVSGAHIMLPPAIIAGHNATSLVHKKVVVAGSRITDPIAVIKTTPKTNTDDDSELMTHCCYPDETFTDQNTSSLCEMCNRMCHPGAMDARHNSHQSRTMCRCYAVEPCLHISFMIDKTVSNHANVPVLYGTFTLSKFYQLTFRVLTIISCFSAVMNAFVYYFLHSLEHSRYIENFSIGIASSTYTAFLSEKTRKPTPADFKSSSIYKLIVIINPYGWQLMTHYELYNILKSMNNVSKYYKVISKRTTFSKLYWFYQLIDISMSFYGIDIFHQVDEKMINFLRYHKILGITIPIKPSIVYGLIPGLVNIMVYIYLFKCKEIQISSIHPDLINCYAKRISTRNLMFKLSVLMFSVDFVYILDIIMEWDITAIHILHLLKSAHGIFITYILLFRPFAPVLFNILLKYLWRRGRSANEETANPIYTITAV